MVSCHFVLGDSSCETDRYYAAVLGDRSHEIELIRAQLSAIERMKPKPDLFVDEYRNVTENDVVL